MTWFRILFLAGMAFALPLAAQVPRIIDYQGRITVREENFDGTGRFKFALVDGLGTTTHWSHDGTSTGGAAPASFVSVPVVKGLYTVRLGDTALANMGALSPGVFDHPDVRLRVWFDDGATGFQQLAPDRRIAAVAYALLADDVPDGSITTAKLAPGSVTADKLAPGVGVGDAPGGVVVSPDPADAALLGEGYLALHTYPGGEWGNPAAANAPSGRRRHTAVWTGSSAIVWGGEVSGFLSDQGGIYTPETNTWSLLGSNAASPPRADHIAIWTGARLVVWGGLTAGGVSNTGALYDPATQTWLPTATTNAPDARTGHSAVWTDTQIIVWGGGNASGALASGAIYTPPAGLLADGNNGTWSALSAAGAPPSARRDHAAVWAAGRMVIWGGEASDGTALNDGAVYLPGSGWTALPASPLSARFGHTAVVAGDRVIFFGGASVRFGAVLNDGAIYHASTSTWTLLPSTGAPAGRHFHQTVWTGTEVLILGGELGNGQPVLSGGAFHPEQGKWRSLPALAETTTRQTATWSGARVVVFGSSGLRLLDPKPPATLYGKF